MKPTMPMKTYLRISALVALGVALATSAGAAFESIQLSPDNLLPQFPLSLRADGITKGNAIVAINVGADGKLTEWLVLGYTHEEFARQCVAALKEWQFTPAKLDGTPVPAMTELTFNFTLEGAVITTNITNHFLFDKFEGMGDGRYVYRMRGSSEIDRVPARVSTVAPKYALEAEKQGVRGKVAVWFYIDETGAVRMPVVDAAADPYLADTAVAAVRGWRFEPPTIHGEPVLVAANQVFDFSSAK
jgi:TonB family protein